MKGRVVIVPKASAGVRLVALLAGPDGLGSRPRARRALERGQVYVNDVEATPRDAGSRLALGDSIRIWIDRPGSHAQRRGRAAAKGGLEIVYEDDCIVVVNKPDGLLTVPLPIRDDAPSVQDMLAIHLRGRGRRRPLVVHRIDRDTSGLVVFATRTDAFGRLRDQFRRHEPERVYLAVVYGCPTPEAGTWRDTLAWDPRALVQKETHVRDPRGKEAVCRYHVRETFRDASLLEVRLVTGRRNQIRLQARARGHTLVGEQRYVYGPDTLRTIDFPRQALHAHRLEFKHPATQRPMAFEAPLPRDMSDLIDRLRQGVQQREPKVPRRGLTE